VRMTASVPCLLVLCLSWVVLSSFWCFSSAQSPSAASSAPGGASLTFQIEPREEQCFYEDIPLNKLFKIQFEVIRGGLLDINFKAYDSYNQVIAERLAFFNRADDTANDADGRVEFTSRLAGVHRLCFDNSMSRWTPKIVTVSVIDGSGGDRKGEIAKLSHLGAIVDSVIKIADTVDNVESLQHHYKVREIYHRDHIEADNARVQWLTILECVLLVGLATFQLRSIMNWFAEHKKFVRV